MRRIEIPKPLARYQVVWTPYGTTDEVDMGKFYTLSAAWKCWKRWDAGDLIVRIKHLW